MNIVKLGCRCGTLWFFNLLSAKKLISASNLINLTHFPKWLRKSAKSLLYKTKKLRNSEPVEVSARARPSTSRCWPPTANGPRQHSASQTYSGAVSLMRLRWAGSTWCDLSGKVFLSFVSRSARLFSALLSTSFVVLQMS